MTIWAQGGRKQAAQGDRRSHFHPAHTTLHLFETNTVSLLLPMLWFQFSLFFPRWIMSMLLFGAMVPMSEAYLHDPPQPLLCLTSLAPALASCSMSFLFFLDCMSREFFTFFGVFVSRVAMLCFWPVLSARCMEFRGFGFHRSSYRWILIYG